MVSGISQPEFGRRLRELRLSRGLSQRDLADGVVNPSYVSLLESGLRAPTLEIALQFARALQVPLRELVPAAVLAESQSQQVNGDQLVRDLLARDAVDYGDLAAAAARFGAAYEEAKTAGSSIAALQYGFALDEILSMQSEHGARYRLVIELAELAQATPVTELGIKVRIIRASAARQTGRLAEALDEAEAARREIVGTVFFQSSQHVRLLAILIAVLCDGGNTAAVPALVAEMLEIADKIDSPQLAGRAHWTASVAFARTGDAASAVDHIRLASQMLASPTTPLREWAQFSRSAASALLDAEAELAEVERFLRAARTATAAAEVPGEAPLLGSVEGRYALAAGDPARALELASQVDEKALVGYELARLLLCKGRALFRLGRVQPAMEQMRRAAKLCDEMAAYQLAASIWREIDQMRSTAED